MSNSLEGKVADRKRVSSKIFGNHGTAIPILCRFDKAGFLHNKDNKRISRIVLKGVNYAPESSFNLFSVSHSLKKGWKIYGNFAGFTLTKGSAKINFDIRIRSGSGYLWATRLVPEGTSELKVETVNLGKVITVPSDSENSETSDTTTAPKAADTKFCSRQAHTSGDAAVSTGLIRGKYMCNGITKEYAHVLMGHANLRTALASVNYLKFRMCTDNSRCRQVIACEGCARGKARKKVSIFAEPLHT